MLWKKVDLFETFIIKSSIIISSFKDGNLLIVDNLDYKETKTKNFISSIDKMKIDNSHPRESARCPSTHSAHQLISRNPVPEPGYGNEAAAAMPPRTGQRP